MTLIPVSFGLRSTLKSIHFKTDRTVNAKALFNDMFSIMRGLVVVLKYILI